MFQPKAAVTSIGLCSTSDVITFDQNWHLYSTSAGEKDLSSDTQIKVIDSMEPEISTKMLGNFSKNLPAKFPAITLSYTIVTIARLIDAFSEIFELEVAPSRRSISAAKRKEKKRRKRKGAKN